MPSYYKLARPDGWDFYTGKTINYRDALKAGGVVNHPHPQPALGICSLGLLHACLQAEQCFIGARIPCSLFIVEGEPVVEDTQMAGFTRLVVTQELDPARYFKWRYAEAAAPIKPFSLTPPPIDDPIIRLLKEWVSVRDKVGDSMRGVSVRDSVRTSAQVSVGDSMRGESVLVSVLVSVWDSMRDSVWAKVRTSVWGESVLVSVLVSVRDSVLAYVGYLFVPVVPAWQTEYPFQSSVDLWRQGLVPSFDGKTWRLHGGPKATVLYEYKKPG